MTSNQTFLSEKLPKHFIFYQPRDIVSGDFYWLGESNDYLYLAVADCTGHGVPGAFMSVLGMNLLKESMSSITDAMPNQILAWMNNEVRKALNQQTDNSKSKEGMDMAILRFDLNQNKVMYAGAKRPLYMVKNKEFTMIKGEAFSVGFNHVKRGGAKYINHEVHIENGLTLYLSSDGFADQLGGPTSASKKFMHKNFRELLHNISSLEVDKQKDIIKNRFNDWKNQGRQTDDVMVIGISL